jgi:ubiquinone/menaquinone biosynthesis C-methylase UbiE
MAPMTSGPQSEAAPGFDLAGHKDGHPERLDREQHADTQIEAQHLARYMWAAALADGKRVLDAGCGTGYGTRMLAARASAVAGIDLAGDVVEAIAPSMPANVTLTQGDLRELPYEDDSFDLISCFEVIEHVEDQAAVLDELRRVLAPGGLLGISSPNPDVFPPTNPHHIRELTPDQLRESLEPRFAHVALLRQDDWSCTTVFSQSQVETGDGVPIAGVTAGKATSRAPGPIPFSVALAGDGELPAVDGTVMLTGGIEHQELVHRLHTMISEQQREIGRLALDTAERDSLRSRLLDLETQLAELPDLYARRTELEAVKASPSWRLTKPLRGAKRLFNRRG